ncbi:MAG TPA: hypothetical protein ENN03_11925 [bacterium]|mgnify:CR=1 FL=1|nr:hypothetical protein [bacterium]
MSKARWIICLFLLASTSRAQQFYRSEGLRLFNQGHYSVAIDSMLAWSEIHRSEQGMAFYYIGESFYNLGLDAGSADQAMDFFRQGSQYLERSIRQTDMASIYAEKMSEAKYKSAWTLFRLSELESDPVLFLQNAIRQFRDLSASSEDSISIFSSYMAGESLLRLAEHYRRQIQISNNPGDIVAKAGSAVQSLNEGIQIFRQVSNSRLIPGYLRVSARLRHQDIFMEKSRLYRVMKTDVFERFDDPDKRSSTLETTLMFLNRADYSGILNGIDSKTREDYLPAVIYSQVVKNLEISLVSGDDQNRQRLNTMLDSLRWNRFRADKLFYEANRDHNTDIDQEAYYRLIDTSRSLYSMAANTYPEAIYWLGWAQFVANNKESSRQFSRFLRETEPLKDDSRMKVLREDAQYMLMVIEFDNNAGNKRVLTNLKESIQNFQPSIPFVRERTNMLLQLVRVILNERIWGRILDAAAPEDRLDDAFKLIQQMMIRASRVTGKDRLPYLKGLELLFTVTTDRRTEQTYFYQGMATFLEAEIQETVQNKRRYYQSAADLIRLTRGEYIDEAAYIEARSYFAMAKHEATDSRRERVLRRAKPIFTRLINEKQSLRSLYYLAEILRTEGKDAAARICYQKVIAATKDKPDGNFWYNNALAGLKSCAAGTDTTDLHGIRINDVIFPDNLLVEKGVAISLEKFADPAFVRRKYREDTIYMLALFGLPPRQLYPAVSRIVHSRFHRRTFPEVTAGIPERIGVISSGLQLKVIFPENHPRQAEVRLDKQTISMNAQGFYRKTPVTINQVLEIRVESPYCYPFIEDYRFTRPGVEHKVVPLTIKNRYAYRGIGIEQGIGVLFLQERTDENINIHEFAGTINPNTELVKRFKADVKYRDFAYSPVLDAFLAVHSDGKIMVFNNNSQMNYQGEFPLVWPQGVAPFKHPEGIAVDSRGRIFITEWGAHRIDIFDSDGTYIRSVGRFGRNDASRIGFDARFTLPARLSIAEDTEGIFYQGKKINRMPLIFVTDRNGVHVIDTFGYLLDTFVPAAMDMGSMHDILVRGYAENMRLFIADRKNRRVQFYTASPVPIQ